MATTAKPRLKTTFCKSRVIEPLHTNGPVAVAFNGVWMATCVSEEILLTDVGTAQLITKLPTDSSTVTALCITPSGKALLAFTSSLSLRMYDTSEVVSPKSNSSFPCRAVSRVHDAPVHVCCTDASSTYAASGSADGVVKVWDVRHGYATHFFRGHGGVISALAFNSPSTTSTDNYARALLLATASVDTKIRIFSLNPSNSNKSQGPLAVLDNHVSVPRGLSFSRDGYWFLSGGRDGVALLWNLSAFLKSFHKQDGGKKQSPPVLHKTIPILERVESIGFLQSEGTQKPEELLFYTGGERGAIRIWDGVTGAAKSTFVSNIQEEGDLDEQQGILDVLFARESSQLVSVYADQNILFHDIACGNIDRQFVGYNDEIVDAALLSPNSQLLDSHLAVATNSSLIRVYSMENLDVRLLAGHSDVVLCIDRGAKPQLLISGSKDRTARVWSTTAEDGMSYSCRAICEGHAESIGAIAIAKSSSPTFMVTGSQDRTVKLWGLAPLQEVSSPLDDVPRLKSLATVRAHDKDINSIDIAPNDKFLATGSQDKTAKVFAIEYVTQKSGSSTASLNFLGVCTGHKRGVWTVRFAKAERVLATGSGDKTIRVWSLDDFSCLKTLEGHTNSVLRLDFLNYGMQLVSSASDGLVKVWNIRTEECVTTLDNHEDKIWALALSSDEQTIISGGADSVVTFWEDDTAEEQKRIETEREEAVNREQDFANYLSLQDYRKAINLALSMNQPGRLLSLFTQVRVEAESGSASGLHSVDAVLETLGPTDTARLLQHIRVWNTTAKSHFIAQSILHAILKLRKMDAIHDAFNGAIIPLDESQKQGVTLKETVDALIPYTERHLSRMERLIQESFVVDYILTEMDGGMFDEQTMMIDDA